MSRATPSRRGRIGRLVVLVSMCALVLTGCEFSVYKLPLPGGADLGDNPYSVRVAFRDVLDLVPQSAVKVNDVSVGAVDDVKVTGYTAEVTLLVNDSVKLPDNALATIRQTSLLGEKFVSLDAPAQGASSNRLEDGDFIPLERSGRNPEVEEVLGALSLLLNGGGVGQLKTIAVELNKALEGREGDVKSVLAQLDLFTGQLDEGKSDIVDAIESLNRLAISINKEEDSIKLALDELPAGLASINRQRDDLIKMLDALDDLSNVAVGVIQQSKAGTIDSLQLLDPILTKLGDAGDAFPKALQVFLTYPFVDEVVGRNPTQARNLHMGDYTNLSAQIDLDLSDLGSEGGPRPGPEVVCENVPQLGKELCGDALQDVLDCLANPSLGNPACAGLPGALIRTLCKNAPGQVARLCSTGTPDPPTVPAPGVSDLEKCFSSGKPNGAACDKVRAKTIVYQCTHRKAKNYRSETCREFRRLVELGDVPGGTGGLPDLPDVPGLGRSAPGTGSDAPRPATGAGAEPAYDSDLGAMLVWGMVQR